jgi:hypothetical protein
MLIVIPPGQSIAKVSASVSLSRDEATDLLDALGAVLARGRSRWSVGAAWGEHQTEVNVMMTLHDQRRSRV